MKIIKPQKLRKGDTIGIVSPSGTIIGKKERTERFNKGIKELHQLGFKTKLARHANGKYFYSAGTPKERASDIHAMFRDKNVQAIMWTQGGDTANEVLPLLDFDLIKANPKIFVGMSDGATLLAPITDKTGLVTFYGPDVMYTFGAKIHPKAKSQILKCLMSGDCTLEPIKDLKDDAGNKTSPRRTWREGTVKGRLIGGYLDIILGLSSTGYLSIRKGDILYIECMESSNIIHARLQYLKLMGIFDKIGGLILGYFPDIKSDKRHFREIGDIVLELTKGMKFPILQVNELGHLIQNYAWPNGAQVELDATSKKITVLDSRIV